MLDKLMKFLNITTNETDFENVPNQQNLLKRFNGIVLEKKENELIIGSSTNNKLKLRVLVTQKILLPNMVYPSLYDKTGRSIDFEQISIRDKILIEFDNDLTEDINIPINNGNTILNLIDYDIKERLEKL